MNKVILVGRLTKDPELRYTQSAEPVPVSQFDLAVDRKFRDKNGEPITDFFRIVVWRKQAENVKKFCFKGSLVLVEGELQSRSYDAEDGTKKYITEVVAERVQFLSPKKDQNNNSEEHEPEYNEATGEVEDPYADFGNTVEISDDDLPF
jgi:single-strand DNA-binding protein